MNLTAGKMSCGGRGAVPSLLGAGDGGVAEACPCWGIRLLQRATSLQVAEDGERSIWGCLWRAALLWQAGRGGTDWADPADSSLWPWEEEREM